MLQAVSVRHDNESRLANKVGSQGVSFCRRKEEDDEGGSGGSGGSGNHSGRQLAFMAGTINLQASAARAPGLVVIQKGRKGSKGSKGKQGKQGRSKGREGRGGDKVRDPIDGGASITGSLWLACTWCDRRKWSTSRPPLGTLLALLRHS